MAEGPLGGALGGEEENFQIEAADDLARAEAFAEMTAKQ